MASLWGRLGLASRPRPHSSRRRHRFVATLLPTSSSPASSSAHSPSSALLALTLTLTLSLSPSLARLLGFLSPRARALLPSHLLCHATPARGHKIGGSGRDPLTPPILRPPPLVCPRSIANFHPSRYPPPLPTLLFSLQWPRDASGFARNDLRRRLPSCPLRRLVSLLICFQVVPLLNSLRRISAVAYTPYRPPPLHTPSRSFDPPPLRPCTVSLLTPSSSSNEVWAKVSRSFFLTASPASPPFALLDSHR